MRKAEDKIRLRERRIKIQTWFRETYGLRVDFPNSGGSGTTNVGNLARWIFRNYVISASVLGLDEALLLNFRTILIALNCHQPLNLAAFQKLCTETLELYTAKYSWFRMTPTVHKILVHSPEIIEKR